MAPKRILVVGASGFLGSNVALAARDEYAVVVHSFRTPVCDTGMISITADLTLPGSASRLVREAKPDVVINCAALADVDACEANPELARQMNADAPGEIADACRLHNATFVHISTDAVFGDGPGPWRPSSSPHPINVYGRTKASGEQQVLSQMSRALVVRTNIVGWSPDGRRSLLEFFYNRLSSGQSTPGFTDVLFRPLAVCDLWRLLNKLIESGTHGIWHAMGADLISKFAFGVMVARTFGFDEALVEPRKVAEAGLVARRASNLDVEPTRESSRSGTAPATIADGLRHLRDQHVQGHRQALRDFLTNRVH